MEFFRTRKCFEIGPGNSCSIVFSEIHNEDDNTNSAMEIIADFSVQIIFLIALPLRSEG
jgi:hypothetical protein